MHIIIVFDLVGSQIIYVEDFLKEENKMLILIVGSPASGKTTIARELCQRFNENYPSYFIYHLEVDDIREMVVNEELTKEVNSKWLNILINILLSIRDTKKIVLIEGLFVYQETISYINSFVEINYYFLIKSDLQECLIRNRKRKQQNEILSDDEIRKLYKIKRPNYFFNIKNNTDSKSAVDEIWNHLSTNY